jgi:hypothetical protein
LVIGKDIRHRRNAGAAIAGEVAGEVAADAAGAVLSPITQIVDSFSNFGSMINSVVQTAYMVKEYELNKKQLAISEEELTLNRLQTKLAEETLDWEKEKFRIEQILNQEDTEAAHELQKQLNANMVDAMGRMTEFLKDLVDVTKNQDLWPMYREIKSSTKWLMEVVETEEQYNRVQHSRQMLKYDIQNGDFDFKRFYHVVNHVVEQMTRTCDYQAISNLTIQINLMFNLLQSIFKNDESMLNTNSIIAAHLESKQKYFLRKSYLFHVRKNWLMNEPVLIGSQLCFEPYYKNTNTSNVCYDYDDKWKLPSVNDGDLGNDCFAKCGNKTGQCSACGYVGYCCSKTNFDPNNQETDPSSCPSSAILAASRKSGMNSDEHTCIFKQEPEKIYAVLHGDEFEGDVVEMLYAGKLNNMPSYEYEEYNSVLFHKNESWQLMQTFHDDNVTVEEFLLKADSLDLLDIKRYETEDIMGELKFTFFDDFEEAERFLNTPHWLDITVDASDGKSNNFLSGKYNFYKMINNAPSYIKLSVNEEIVIFFWYTGDSWVFTEEEMFEKKNPTNWLKLETVDTNIKYLGTDWLENSKDFSKVLIDFLPRYLDITDKIFFDFRANPSYNNGFDEKVHRKYGGEYKLAGRLNNKPYYKQWIDYQDSKILIFKDSLWYFCDEIKGEKTCQINLKEKYMRKQYDENYEIKTDRDFNNLFDDNRWVMLSTTGSTITNMLISYIDEKPSGFDQERIRINVRSSNEVSYLYWRGDNVRIVQRNKFGEYIAEDLILKAGEAEQSTYFDVRPDDAFIILNGGNDGVYIKELLFGDKVIKVNGQSSFWIDGNYKECDASKVIAVSKLVVVNGEVTNSSCND